MREIQMWKDTPTAPYSLKTFFSCCVLLGFPPPGSSGWLEVFGEDVELTESAITFSWRIKKKKKKKSKSWRQAEPDENGGWMNNESRENSSGRRQAARRKNQQRMWMTKRKQLKPVGRLMLWISNVSLLLIFIFQGTPLLTKLASAEIKAYCQTRVMWRGFFALKRTRRKIWTNKQI